MSAAERFEQARESANVGSALRVLRSRWPIALGVIAVCVVVAAVRHERSAKTYVATASVVFQSGTLSESALQVTPGTTEPLREADTEVLVAHSPEVAQAVRQQLGSRAGVEALLGQVKVEAEPNANVLNIIASTGNPRESARLANAFAQQYIAFRAKSELKGIETVQARLQEELAALPEGSAERVNLQQSLQRVGELRAVAGGGANVIGTATPPGAPSGSSLSTSILVGALIGLALAFSIVFVLESLDRRVKTVEEFEREYRLPALSGISQSSFRTRRAAERTDQLEPYRILRSALDFAAVTRQLDTLMVTSAIQGEGKTTVSVDLAHAVALAGRRVVLAELDLRRPTFAQHFALDTREGLTSALTGSTPLAELLIEPFGDVPNLSVLPAGRVPHNPSELLGSERITELIAALVDGADIVILDAPPLNPIADAQVLLHSQAIHSCLLVARASKTSRDDARRARAILDRQMVEPVGLVITGLRDAGRYGYESYAAEQAALEPDVDGLSRRAGSESRGLSL